MHSLAVSRVGLRSSKVIYLNLDDVDWAKRQAHLLRRSGALSHVNATFGRLAELAFSKGWGTGHHVAPRATEPRAGAASAVAACFPKTVHFSGV